MVFMRRAAEKKRIAKKEAQLLKQISDAREAKKAEEKAYEEAKLENSNRDMFNYEQTLLTENSVDKRNNRSPLLLKKGVKSIVTLPTE